MMPADKPIVWLRGEVKTPPFSKEARIEAGVLLRQLQQGVRLTMPHSRPMTVIGARCHELRIPDADQTFRIVYRLDSDGIVIGEVFSKKTGTTPKSVIANCRRRFQAYDRIASGEKGMT